MQRRVKDIDAVGCHDNFDVLFRFEAVQLVEKFQHRPLHFTVATRTTLHASRPDRVNLVHEDDRRGMLSTKTTTKSNRTCLYKAEKNILFTKTIKMFYLAITKSSRTIRAPSPMNF